MAARLTAILVLALALVLAGHELRPGEDPPRLVPVAAPPGERTKPARDRVTSPTRRSTPPLPGPRRMTAARAFADSRQGLVSFAVIDSRGGLHALDGRRRYVSASVVKAMLLIAEVNRLSNQGLALDPQTRSLLEQMITHSDNDAADAIYARVGDAGLFEVARRAGLERFTVAGHWGNAEVAASDMALMMSRLDELLEGAHAAFASGVLERVVTEQRWGIPSAAAGDGWRQRFKGGWRPTELGQLVHQVARLDRGRTAVSLAVLSDGAPSLIYGIATVRGIAERLLSAPPAPGAHGSPGRARSEWRPRRPRG